MGALKQPGVSNKIEAELPDEFQRQFKLMENTLKPLESDLIYADKQWQKEQESQFWSRTVIRCLCAAIEARLFFFRKLALELGAVNSIQYAKEEVEILTEQRDPKGMDEVRPKKPKWLPFNDSVKVTLRLLAKSVGATAKINFGVIGFSELCKTVEIRNGLMHPKRPSDTEISLQKIETAKQGINWFNETYAGVLRQCLEHLERVNASRNK